MQKILHYLRIFFLCIELFALLVLGANMWVISYTQGHTYTKISKIPARHTALVLGTSPRTKAGNANPYFISRMHATALLYHYGKVKKIIVSGEKSKGYNEPQAMRNFLVYQQGIPERAILSDTLGFNTMQSIQRCKTHFKKQDIIIVSQAYHNMRALFYARNMGLDAVAFDARAILSPQSYYRNEFREIMARTQAALYYLIGYSPT